MNLLRIQNINYQREIRILNTICSGMGHSYTYRCTFCGYEEEFNHGHGFLVHSQPVKTYLNQKNRYFHYKTHQLIKKLSELHEDLFIKAGFEVYKCPRCKILTDKVEVTIFESDKVVHKSEFRCNKCRSRLRLTNIHRLQKATCPKCNKKSFQLNHSLQHLWD